MSEYSAGPWSVSTRNSWRVADAHDNTIASTGTDSAISHSAHIANARLIAAAPNMLDAHTENARVLRFLVNELQGRVEGGKLAAMQACLDRCDESIAAALNHD